MSINALLLLILLCTTSCKSPTLSVHAEYYSRQDLASYIIDTPDPKKQQSIFGQHLFITWNAFHKAPLELKVNVLLKNGDRLEKTIPITKTSGNYSFPIVGKDYIEKGGLLSYKVELLSNGTVVETSRHKFWVEPIHIRD